MRKINILITVVTFALLMVGCNKKVETNKEIATTAITAEESVNGKVENSDLICPTYKEDILLTDLQNCNLIFYKGMIAKNFTAYLYSIKQLDIEAISVSFDTDMKYEVSIIEEDKMGSEYFGYSLFCAYNKEKIENYGDLVDGISMNDYKLLIEGKVPEFHRYKVLVSLDINEKEDNALGDYEINNMSIKIDSKEYNFYVGSIKYDYTKKMNEKFATDLAGEESAYVASAALNFIQTDNTKEGLFIIDVDEIIQTEKKEVTIKSIKIKNSDSKIEDIKILLKNEKQNIDMKMKEGQEVTIPQNTLISIKLLCQKDSYKNNIGEYEVIVLEIDYSIDGKEDSLDFQVVTKGSLRTPYELYAYEVDGIDIFGSYLENISFYDIYKF